MSHFRCLRCTKVSVQAQCF